MPTTLTAADTVPLLRLADQQAHRVCRKAGLPPQDREDLRQDLLLDLLSRLRSFEPNRGTLAALASTCFRHRAGRLTARARRERAFRHPVSLDAPLPGSDGLAMGDTVAEADGYSAWLGQPTDAITATERRLDLDRALGSLPRTALPLCAALTGQTPHELAEAGYAPRTSLYRQVRGLRLDLLAAGVAPPWNGSSPAWVEG
jgi:RNA polymerase sigma-70 factor (ECF subfamily)